jgi:hypothetical protein
MGIFQQNKKTWEPPMELQRSTPREVELTGGGKAAAVSALLLVIAVFVGTVLLVQKSARDAAQWESWKAETASTQGEVTRLRKTASGDDTRYWADYQYKAGEQSLAGTAHVRRERWRTLKPGDAIQVFYRRSEPETSWLSGAEPTGMPMWVPIVFVPSVLLPIVLIVWQLRRQRRLLEEGRAALATVTKVRKSNTQHGKRYRVEYEFNAGEGSTRRGKWEAGRMPFETGQEFTVIYLPDEEKWSARYPLSLVRVRRD